MLILASIWGFLEASVASVAATLTFNFFFFPPVGRFTIADPQNWVALFSFLTTALIASRLSGEVKRRALDAVERKQDLERLYTFSRAILLIDHTEPFPKQLVRKLAEIFELGAVVLYERRAEEFYHAGPLDFDGLDDQLRDAALQGTSFTDAQRNRVITAVRLARSRLRASPSRALRCRMPCFRESPTWWLSDGTGAGQISPLRSRLRGEAKSFERRCWTRWRMSSRPL